MHRLFYRLLMLLLLVAGSGQTTVEQPSGMLSAAQKYYDTANYEAALALAQQALEAAPQGDTLAGRCLLLLGDVFLETGNWDAAKEQFEAAKNIFIQKNGSENALTADAFNRLGACYFKKNDLQQAAAWYQKALQIRLRVFGEQHESIADSYNNLGNCAVNEGHYPKATALHQQALHIRQARLPENHPDLATSYNNLGNCAYLSGAFNSALEWFEKSRIIRQQVLGASHPKTAQVLNNLGNVHAALGHRDIAIQQYQQALDIRRQHFGPQHPSVASALENLGNLLFENHDYISALDCYRQAYAIQQGLQGETSVAAATLWHNIGLCYQYEGDYAKALEYHLAAGTVLTRSLDKNHPDMAGYYNNLGNTLAGIKSFAQATAAYQKALPILEAGQPVDYTNLALVYNNLGSVLLEQKQPEQALHCFNKAWKALEANTPATPESQAWCLKNKGEALVMLHDWEEAFQVFTQAMQLAAQADVATETAVLDTWAALLSQRGVQTVDTGLLYQALRVFDRSREKADGFQRSLFNPATRQRWLEIQFPAQVHALEACFLLWEKTGEPALLEKAFAIVERNKSIQLLEQLRQEQAARQAAIPDSLLEQERFWQTTLNLREKEWMANGAQGNAAASEALALARQSLLAVQHQMARDFPAYQQWKSSHQTTTLAAVQQQAQARGAAFLEYFVADSAIFVFVATPDRLQCLRLPRPPDLDSLVTTFRHSLQAYPTASGAMAATLSRRYIQSASALYAAIFAPVEQHVALPRRLTIVPDGVLSYLPFECLITAPVAEETQHKNHPYLLRRHCIGYAYSASQQQALLDRESIHLPHTLLAVAPTYASGRYGLNGLQNNQGEAVAVHALLGGKLLSGETATVPAFLREAGTYKILLLSMHGKASAAVGDLSYIAFSTTGDTTQNPFLYTRDLYAHSLPAELVVLSACETNVGAYRFGQGVISLAKGFFQAGAHSVAATLWSVDDARHAELMRLFLTRIKDGADKAEALHEAKLAYLQSHPHDEANPVFWGAVTVYGDTCPIPLHTIYPVWWLLAVVALAAAWVWWRFKVAKTA
jgi:CHAT domain-containing protein/tetratricopeptide (TPR) repeat protein